MRTPVILSALEKYAEKNPVRFHMPGHKGSEEFCKIFGAAIDVTELSFSDVLSSPNGIIKEAQENIAAIFGARASYIMTGGSTLGILAMVHAMKGRGSKLILQRNSHKSVYNAMALSGLEPVFLPTEFVGGIPVPDLAAIPELASGDVAGAVITSPDYYGLVPDLKTAKAALGSRGALLAVDGAHGAHLKFSAPELYAGNFADMWVDGVHKTLPSLTQAAVLNISDESLKNGVEEGLSLYGSTSPSYPIMASAEYGVYYAESVGFVGYRALIEKIAAFKRAAEDMGYAFYKSADETKIVLDAALSGADAATLAAYLENNGVYPEFTDGRYVVFLASVMNRAPDFDRLSSLLKNYTRNEKAAFFAQKTPFSLPVRAMAYAEAKRRESEYIELSAAEGRISAAEAGLFPPCFPLVVAGEVIDGNAVRALLKGNAFGVSGGRIKVVK